MEYSNIKSGSMQLWGEWFGGRPGENYHIVIETYWEKDDVLVIKFNEGEILTIHNPTNIVSSEKEFYIKDASLIIFEWFYYGRERTPENLRHLEYKTISDDQVLFTETDIEDPKIIEKKKINKRGLIAVLIA